MPPILIDPAHLKGKALGDGDNVMSAAEDLEPERLTVAEENAERLEIQTPGSLPDSPPPVDRLRARLRGRLMMKRSEDRLKAAHRNIQSTSPEF